MNEVYEVMKKYGKFMAGLDYPVGNARLVQMTSEGVFSTVDGCDLSDLKEEDSHQASGRYYACTLRGHESSCIFSRRHTAWNGYAEADPLTLP